MTACVFAGIKDEKPKADETMYVCVHGKVLTWTTARRHLGLPVERPIIEKEKE